eukprot:CAMPEP_0115717678 /NCGR_PEP_ID=MMETSP0272-20121206/77003_1 /TAXON_ID=71861 /ORGANISM="Scrippsiella trochoidea, Strain CCMP3099" /LENGTH=119 /DNA_ID=CAMNT_0003160111 /DNA_START=247 /DNA_END=604 /DNA_ORIENTATION=+
MYDGAGFWGDFPDASRAASSASSTFANRGGKTCNAAPPPSGGAALSFASVALPSQVVRTTPFNASAASAAALCGKSGGPTSSGRGGASVALPGGEGPGQDEGAVFPEVVERRRIKWSER